MAQLALPTSIEFAMPPVLHNGQGRVRTVGIEVEFVGPTAEQTILALREKLGG